jgi:hypothetical protein
MHHAQWVSVLTPRLNDATAAMTTAYQEQGNSLKLVLPRGDIDFIVSGPISDATAIESLAFTGRTFLLEATEEILAKKLFYRAAHFQPRDIFDFVVAIEKDRASVARALAAAAANLDLLTRRIQTIVPAARGQAGRRDRAARRFLPCRTGNDRGGPHIREERREPLTAVRVGIFMP